MRSILVALFLALLPGAAGAAETPPAAKDSPKAAPAGKVDFAFIIADLRGIPRSWLAGDPDGCPVFRDLAREGLAFVSLAGGGADPDGSFRTLVGAGERSIFRKARERWPAERLWLLAPHAAGEMAELAGGARFFAPDPRLPAFRHLLRRFGPAPALDEGELEALRRLRGRYGAEPTAFEEGLGLVAGGAVAPDADAIVLDRLVRLVAARKASFVVAVLGRPCSAGDGEKARRDAVKMTDGAIGRLRGLISEEPYRNRTLLAWISLAGLDVTGDPPARPDPEEGSGVVAAPGLRKGTVFQEGTGIGAVRSLLFRCLDLEGARAAFPTIPAEVFEP